MEIKRHRRMSLKGAIVCGTLCLSMVDASYGTESGFLRRKALETSQSSNDSQAEVEEALSLKTHIGKMEDFWDRAAAVAQIELDVARMLQDSSSQDYTMSMPSRPPALPTPTDPSPAIPSSIPTPSPVSAPVDCLLGRTRQEYIYDLLVPITSASILNDPTTPQGMAYDYMANVDPHLTDPCLSDTIEQRYALITLYYSTNGEDWATTQGWLGQDQECLWYGVDCTGGDPDIVTEVALPSNNLVGKIPDELKALESLEQIDFFANTMTGTIPSGIAELTHLILLDLEQNLLSGQVFPSHIYDMKALLAYRVSDNFLSGSISTEIHLLERLQQLWAATNQITGTIPTQLGAPSDLESIFLNENSLVGTLPSELGNLAGLEHLRVYQNTLQGNIPTELFSATNLESLRLDYNFFSGSVPTEVGKLTSLTDLRIDTNGLSGSLPSELGNLVLLENFILHNNFLTGQIPNVFGNFAAMDFLDAANNLFFGSIPETLFEISTLRLLYLSNNTLSGTIPPEYSEPPLLRDLYLDGNGLIGTVPSIISGQLQNLNEFLVHFNFLSGTMPESVCSLTTSGNLEDLFADCGGSNPEIECAYPGCCNRCFEGGNVASRERRRRAEWDRKRALLSTR